MSEIKLDMNRYFTVDGETHITPKNLPEEKTEREPAKGSVEIDGLGSGGFRVKWNYTKEAQDTDKVGVVVEELDDAGEWKPVRGIQKLSIEFDVDKYVPTVKMERVIF